ITVTGTDSKNGSTPATTTLPTTKFSLDIKAGGTGVAIGKVADTNDLFDVNLPTNFSKQVVFKQDEQSVNTTDNSFPAFLIESDVEAVDTFYRATRTDTGTSLAIGVGSGGYNHGVWSGLMGQWMIYADQNENVGIRSNGNLVISAPTQGVSSRNYGENKVLWSGAYWPNETHTCTFSESLSAQPNGIIVAWSYYTNNAAQNYNFMYFFVPKYHVKFNNTRGVIMQNPYHGMQKYIYVNDTYIKGNASNDEDGTYN